MSVRTRSHRKEGLSAQARRYLRKADQEWESAGLARRDGDLKAAADHTLKAREYEQLYRDSQ